MADMTEPVADYIGVVEAADILGWSRWTVVRALRNPDHPLTGRKMGAATSAWIVDRATVDAILEAAS